MVDEPEVTAVGDDEIDAAQGEQVPELAEDVLDDVSGGVVFEQAPGMLFHRDGD